MIEIGSILVNNYKILKQIGKGGMGSVYLAENVRLGNKWAIKEIDLTADKNIDLLAEPEMLKKLNHKSLPKIVDIIHEDNYIYIVEDYFEGNNLKELLKTQKKFSEKIVVSWAKQLCEILIYLHTIKPNPIIYRDMKPGNIIVDKDNNIKLIDFGIAREYKKGQEEDTTYIGTKGYAAPEQLSKSGQSDERTDIYSLGVTLHHLLTGKSPDEPPYYLRPIREIDKSLSEGFEKIISKCVHPEPAKRYRKVEVLLKNLNNIHKFSREYQISKAKKLLLLLLSILFIVGGAFTVSTGFENLESLNIEVSQSISANEYLNENIADIADENLEAAIRNHLNKPTGEITASDMETLHSLEAMGMEIDDLRGLEYAKNLSRLNLSDNLIIDLEILSDLTNLTELNLGGNQINDLRPLGGLINLSRLELWDNRITDISALASLINLTELVLRNNQISDVSVLGGLTKLNRLVLGNNKISDVSSLGALINLRILDLGMNQVNDITAIGKLENLSNLVLAHNLITDFKSIEHLENLIHLDISGNELQDMTDESLKTIIVTIPDVYLETAIREEIDKPTGDITAYDMSQLSRFEVIGNKITDLTGIEYAINLVELNLVSNQITDITAVEGLRNLNRLQLVHNQIKDISAIRGLLNIVELDLSFNQITDITAIEGLINLTWLSISFNQVADITVIENLTNLHRLDIAFNPLSEESEDLLDTLRDRGVDVQGFR